MLRVSLSHARPDTEKSAVISGLQFASNHRGGAVASESRRSGSQGAAGGFGTNTILTVPRSDLEHAFDIDLDGRDGSSDTTKSVGSRSRQTLEDNDHHNRGHNIIYFKNSSACPLYDRCITVIDWLDHPDL
jgi:hypothetical protein